MNNWLTIDQAAEHAGVSHNTILKWIKDGLPCAVFSPRLKRIRVENLEAWAARFEGTTISRELPWSLDEYGYVIDKVTKQRI